MHVHWHDPDVLMCLITMIIQLLRIISYLHNDVKETLNGVHLAPQNGRERDSGVEVAAGNMTDSVHEAHDADAEGESNLQNHGIVCKVREQQFVAHTVSYRALLLNDKIWYGTTN
jgi:hypothetical protein